MKDKAGWNKYRRKQPPAEAKECEILIESLTNSGDGLGRIDQRVVFVPYTLPGDRLKVKLTQRKKTYALGQIVEILEPGEQRIEPQCQYFGRCGGCDWQHVPHSEQLLAKKEQLEDTLKRIGGLDDITLEPMVHGERTFGYRNRIQGEIRGGQFHYKHRKSDQRIAIDRCEIADESINQWLASDNKEGYSGRVEVAVVDDEVMVVPVNDNNSTELGFRQINTEVSDILSTRVLKLVADSDCESVVDLYCGRGTWTNQIAAANPQQRVIGVDSAADNIDAARQSAQASALFNAAYHLTPVEKIIHKLPMEQSLCIVDPPRSGLAESVTQQIISHKPAEIIYVSCHPATLARDLKRLTESQYQVNSLVPLDMFPQTAHLETLVHLSAKDV